MYIAIGFYILILILYMIYVYYLLNRTVENFSGVVISTDDPIGQCYECMDFYSPVLNISDTQQLLPTIKILNEFYDTFFASLDKFLQEQKTICPGAGTISDYINCITKYINSMSCPTDLTTADCRLRLNLLSRIVTKSNICPGDRACKTVEEFHDNLVANVASLKEDYATCRAAFETADTPCVKRYIETITTKINAMNVTANKQIDDETTLLTRADLNKAMYDMTTYMATIGYKG